jgi:methylmalonyl-CoA mutase
MSERTAPRHKVRFVTAASLFDGHDAAINIMRRIIQASGAEVVHLGHNRSVREIVDAAIQEDAHGVAISSYQGGHVRFFKYVVDMLREAGCAHIKVFGGGGGVIVKPEIEELQAYGVARIFSPQDGTRLGLQGMIDEMIQAVDQDLCALPFPDLVEGVTAGRHAAIARAISLAEAAGENPDTARGDRAALRQILELGRARTVPVVGITGTGGAGKSSLTDEVVRRFLGAYPELRIGIVSVDPTKRRTGGALLGDRIRMNSLANARSFMRSLATRGSGKELAPASGDALAVLKAAGYDLLILETSGIGQGESAVVDLVDVSVYVMTSEYGAASQLEKIDMLDYADLVALNKFEKGGSQDALRDVRKQVRRARSIPWEVPDEQLPVYGTIASRFDCNGTNWFFDRLMETVRTRTGFTHTHDPLATDGTVVSSELIPAERRNYLAEISRSVRRYKQKARSQAEALGRATRLEAAARELAQRQQHSPELAELAAEAARAVEPATRAAVSEYRELAPRYRATVSTSQCGAAP